MTQAQVDALAIPSTLTKLTIPANRVVGSTLATAASNNGNIDYIYSPSSDAQRLGADKENQFDETKNLVADYVWVVKAGGLAQAFTNEEPLRNSFYINVASSVALNTTDVNFDGLGAYKPTNYLFLDFSASNLTPAMAANYTVTDNLGYRIILPDNWTGDQMAVFAANEHCGALAAVYSYSGTTLKIMEITDGSYSQTALCNPRIMRSTTTEVEVVSGTYNGSSYSNFGNNLLTAINNMGNSTTYPSSAGLNVTKVTISTGANVTSPMNFANPTIETLELKNISLGWAVVNVDGCTSLKTLNMNYSNVGSVTAQVASLTAVDLSGTTINGAANFSNSSLSDGFVTDEDTQITGDLSLMSTSMTSFVPKGTYGGNIYLNASNSLASIDVRQMTQAANKKIHVDNNTADSDENDIISTLKVTNAVTVPTDYVIADHFHPAVDVAYIKREAYIPPMYTITATTMKLHEKEAAANGDHFIYWYDDTTDSGSNVTIGTSTESGHSLADIMNSKSTELGFSSTTYRRAKIEGPVFSADVDDLASINCQVLDLSSATLDATAWTALKTAFAASGTGVHLNVRFVILPDTCTREYIINETALAGLTNVLSVIATNKITGETGDNAYKNGTNLTSCNRVSGALQAAVVAAGNHSCNSWTKTPDGNTSRNIYTSDISDFKECKISGIINSHDLSRANQALNADGHLTWDHDPVEVSSGTDPRKLNGEYTVYGPFGASFNLSVIDLKNAHFEEWDPATYDNTKFTRYWVSDMTLSELGVISTATYKVVIPQDSRVNEVPADFMNCSTNIRAICIPTNIRVIRTRAFYTIDYVWTTSSVGAGMSALDNTDPEGTNTRLDNGAFLSNGTAVSALVYENGKYKENSVFEDNKYYTADYSGVNGGGSYTFGSSLRMIETGAFANTQPNVRDVYVLNTVAPECHVDAFNTVMYTGNGGYNSAKVSDEGIITRDAYYNGRWITMLHYPRQTTTPQLQRYTDPTREYSIATGERDGKGAPIYFPNQSEFIRAYQQGTYGYVWNAWNPTRQYGSVNNEPLTNTTQGWSATGQTTANELFDAYATGANHQYTSFYKVANFTETVTAPTTTIEPYYNVYWTGSAYATSGSEDQHLYPQSEVDANDDNDGSGEPTPKDYRGWHQFVLNAYAANTILKEEPYRSYITDNEWWTICPTFDITKEECAILFGQAQGIQISSPSQYPYVSKLRYVRRFYGDGKGTITLNFTENLCEKKEFRNPTTSKHGQRDESDILVIQNNEPAGDDVVMSAGVPYLIKPNMGASPKRQFRIFETEADLSNFRAQYTATEWDNRDFVAFYHKTLFDKIKAAQAESGATQIAHVHSGMYTVPVFVSESNGSGLEKENVELKEDGVTPQPYHPTDNVSIYYKSTDWVYTFVGSFYKSFLPHYCYYLGWDSSLNGGNGGARFFYLDGEKNNPGVFTYYDNNMNWNNETGVICPTYSNNGYTTAQSRVFDHTISPATTGSEGMIPAQWKITDLVSDSFTAASGSQGAKTYEMVFGAPDMIADDSDVTGISNIDANNSSDANSNADVYTINGQKVGTSLEGLPKGVYIVNGKKFIVK